MTTTAADHFDHLSPARPPRCRHLPTCASTRPVAWSEEHGGFWVVTRYEDVLRVVQDWRTFSSAQGVSVPAPTTPVNAIPR